MVSLSAVSVASSQPQLENIKWKNSVRKQPIRLKLHPVPSAVMKSRCISLWLCYTFVQHSLRCGCPWPTSYLAVLWAFRFAVAESQCLIPVSIFLLTMGPKAQEWWDGNLRGSMRCTVTPVSDKMGVYHSTGKGVCWGVEKNDALACIAQEMRTKKTSANFVLCLRSRGSICGIQQAFSQDGKGLR